MEFWVISWSFAAGVFGAVVGSFLNVFIYRLPRESLSVARPKRSFCPDCGKSIPWYDNIPIFSYLALNGRCRFCGTSVSIRYPVVELLTALLFASLTWHRGESLLGDGAGQLQLLAVHLVHLYLLSAILVVTFIDLEFQIIPNEITYSGMFLAPLVCAVLPGLQEGSNLFIKTLNPHLAGFVSSVSGALVGGVTMLLIAFLGKAVFKKDALGGGDVKFMIFVGGVFGGESVLLVLLIGCVIGSLVGIPFRIFTGKREIPFGPFLSFGVGMVVYFGWRNLWESVWEFWINLF